MHNFRDLGGYPTSDGRTTKWRTLFRADGLYRLTSGDVALLEPLGLRTVIDLRSAAELDERGRFPVDAHPVVFHHLPIVDADVGHEADRPNYERDEDFLIWAYQEMLTVGGRRGSPRRSRPWPSPTPCRRCSTARPARTAPVCSPHCCSGRSASRTTTSSPTTP